jgi:hypothetical protein
MVWDMYVIWIQPLLHTHVTLPFQLLSGCRRWISWMTLQVSMGKMHSNMALLHCNTTYYWVAPRQRLGRGLNPDQIRSDQIWVQPSPNSHTQS